MTEYQWTDGSYIQKPHDLPFRRLSKKVKTPDGMEWEVLGTVIMHPHIKRNYVKKTEFLVGAQYYEAFTIQEMNCIIETMKKCTGMKLEDVVFG